MSNSICYPAYRPAVGLPRLAFFVLFFLLFLVFGARLARARSNDTPPKRAATTWITSASVSALGGEEHEALEMSS